MTHDDHASECVLVLMPTLEEAERIVQWLEDAELRAFACADIHVLCESLALGAGALLLTDAALQPEPAFELAQLLQAQPDWSDMPVIVVARADASELLPSSGSALLRNPIVLHDMPQVEHPSVLSILASALRSRRGQYRSRELLSECGRTREELAQSKAALVEYAERLRRSDRLKDDFLATLAHELRNPLAPIRTGMDLLATSPPVPVASHTLGVMQRQLGHMVRLIDDLLDISRMTQDRLDLKRERVALTTLLDAALEASRPFIEQGRHQLNLSVCEEPLWFDADLTRAAQIISNLIDNASKYTAPNGHIWLAVRREGAFGVIEVRDDGIGIPSDRLEDVFAMFNQLDRVLDRSHGGLGIGLALVRRLAQLHGGSVVAHSDGPGKGSRFVVRLPLAAASPASTTSASAEPARANDELDSRHKRILVVDDNDDAADLLSLMLEHAGHETTTAHDGPSALAAVQQWSPHIVFLDIGLPGMNGYDVARQLRHDPRFAELSLIALTGWGSGEDKRKAAAAGFDVHLTKPVDARALQGVLDHIAALALEASPRPA
ncbi:MAG: hybrid sensor histidine kinase/response regulator [Polyangiales bacterium]